MQMMDDRRKNLLREWIGIKKDLLHEFSNLHEV